MPVLPDEVEKEKKERAEAFAFYVPFGVKALIGAKEEVGKLVGCQFDNSYSSFFVERLVWDVIHLPVEQVRLLLKPLDLASDVPAEYMIQYFGEEYDTESYAFVEEQKTLLMIRLRSGRVPFSEMRFLMERHYDVFGLIKKGWAKNLNDY